MERLRLAELSRIREKVKNRDLSDFDDQSADDSFVDIKFKGRLIEQIEDGIYNIKRRSSNESEFSLESLNDLGDPRFVDLHGEERPVEQLLFKEHSVKV